MPNFRVYLKTTLDTSVEVNAADASEAEDKAYEQVGHPSLCHQCANDYNADGEFEIYEVGIVEDNDYTQLRVYDNEGKLIE